MTPLTPPYSPLNSLRYRLESLLPYPGRGRHRAGRSHLSRRGGGQGVRPALLGWGPACHGPLPGRGHGLPGHRQGGTGQAGVWSVIPVRYKIPSLKSNKKQDLRFSNLFPSVFNSEYKSLWDENKF